MGGDENASKGESHVVTEAALEKTMNSATVLRYPFQPIDLAWLVDYIDTCLPRAERWPAAMHIVNAFMAFAVMHEDPYLEDATFQFHKTMEEKNDKRSWPKRARDTSVDFEVAHHVFETICVMAKYPNLDPPGKVGLLRMGERLLKDIEKAVTSPSVNVSTKKTSEALSATLTRIQALRRTPDSPETFDSLMGSLKTLFFCFCPCLGVCSMLYDSNTSIMNSYVCCEGCPCYTKLRTTYTLFIRDVEKTKVIDCLLMMAVREDDAFVSKLAEDLFARFDCRSLFLEKPIRRIQNGILFTVRIALFDAFRHVKSLMMELRASPVTLEPLMENIILALHITRREIKDIKGPNEHLPLIDLALATADSICSRLGTEKSSQELRKLKDYIMAIFTLVSAPEYHLAVHSKDPLVGRGANLKCGNPDCPGKVKEMLKCSGCRVTFYCGAECQREDWKTHRFLCREMGCRKTAPQPVKAEECPIQTLKAFAFD